MDEPVMPPSSLRELVAGDLRPVRPLRKPWTRALVALPFALVLLFAAQMSFGLREDAGRLGWILTWGASLLELALGMQLVVLALREAVPGRALPRGALAATFTVALGSVVVVTVVTWLVSPIRITAESVFYVSAFCFGHTLLAALPVILVVGILVARGYATRPLVAGALCGAAGGVMSDAGWRLFCHYSDPWHVFPTHVGAVLAAAFVGMAFGAIVRRR